MTPRPLLLACAAALGIGATAFAWVQWTPGRSGHTRVVTLEVGGMICADCTTRIHDSLAAVPGVRHVDVTLRGQRATVECAASVGDTTLTAAVGRAGPGLLGLVVRP